METRLKIKLTLSPLDKIAEITGRCVIILLWMLSLFAFFKMPDTIPIHFNSSGQPDGYGSKATIFILPSIATIIFTGLTILNYYPHHFNYASKITEANAKYQYTLGTRMLRFLKLIIAILFTAIVSDTFLTSIHVMKGLNAMFLPFIIGIFSIPTIIFIAFSLAKKHR